MKAKINFLMVFVLVIALVLPYSCKRAAVEEPSPFGPSTYSILLNVSASPNVLFAGSLRGVSTITATLKKFTGVPLSNKTIIFEIRDEFGNKGNIGYFEGKKAVVSKITNQSGTIAVDYYGPVAQELAQNRTVYIYAYVAGDGKEEIIETCTIQIVRDTVEMVLSLNVNPNVLFAGTSREVSKVSATLLTPGGTPLVNQTIHLEIHDALGTKINIGYFDNNSPVATKVTDQNGSVSADYYGPLLHEITDNTTIYINATVAGEGKVFTTDTSAIQIIRDVSEMILTLTNKPNVLFAGSTRETSKITATLMSAGRDPLANQTIVFDIRDESGNKVDVGNFEGNESVIAKTTDQNGIATTDYYGPLLNEIANNMTIYVYASVAGEGPGLTSGSIPVYIIRESTGFTFNLIANPNVLWATDQRPQSVLKGFLKTVDGVPIKGRKVYFKILSGPGQFSGGGTKTYALTDSNGIATVTYIGPTKNEISYDQFVTVQGQPETSTPDYIHIEIDIRIIRGN